MSTKYQTINTEDKNALATICVGDYVRINNWHNGMKVAHRTDKYLLLQGKDFAKDVYSVIELFPSTIEHNDRAIGKLTAGPDFWIFGWNGWMDDQGNVNCCDPERMEAYLKSFESGETEFLRRAVAVKSMQVSRHASLGGAV